MPPTGTIAGQMFYIQASGFGSPTFATTTGTYNQYTGFSNILIATGTVPSLSAQNIMVSASGIYQVFCEVLVNIGQKTYIALFLNGGILSNTVTAVNAASSTTISTLLSLNANDVLDVRMQMGFNTESPKNQWVYVQSINFYVNSVGGGGGGGSSTGGGATGAQGPTGPRGATGPQGPTGAMGATGLGLNVFFEPSFLFMGS
jgi:hypothetical protein